MKKEEKKVAKLEKKAKVDTKKVLITNEMAENYMRDKIKKKKGRPKKVSEDLKYLNFNPQLAELKRVTKTMKKASLEDIGGYVGKHIEVSYPILEQVIEKEYFDDLMQSPNAKEILSSNNVKTILSEMIKEYTDFTMDFLNEISDNKFSLSELNTNGEVLNRISQIKEKYNPKLVSEIELYKASINPKKEFNRIVTEYLTDEDFRKLSKEALEKINEVDITSISKESIEEFSKLSNPEIDNKDLREEEKECLPKSELKEEPVNLTKDKSARIALYPLNEYAEANENYSEELGNVILTGNSEAPFISPNTENKEPYLEWVEIKLKNLTDEKLKNVLLFDHHDEYKDRVEYSSSVFQYGIKEFLRQLSSIQKGKYAIRFFRYNASCDLERFAVKQTNAYITAIYSDLTGRIYKIPHRPDHLKNHEERFHETLADITAEKDLSFCSNLSLSLEYLMPETTVSVFIIVEKIDK